MEVEKAKDYVADSFKNIQCSVTRTVTIKKRLAPDLSSLITLVQFYIQLLF